MKISGLAVILVALALAGGVAYLVDLWMVSQQEELEDAKREAALAAEKAEQARRKALAETDDGIAPTVVRVLVAASDLAVGTIIGPQTVRISEIAPEDRPEGVYTRLDQVAGLIVRQPISMGQPIQSSDLVPTAATSLTSDIVAGMRAITLDIGATSGQMKLVRAGSRVDVLLNSNSSGELLMNRMLQNVKVLALDQSRETESRVLQVADSVPSSITLEVTPAQAVRLARAAAAGSVRVLLRNPEDPEVVDDRRRGLSLIRGAAACETVVGQDCR